MFVQKLGQNDKVLILGARGNLGGQLARVFGNEYRLLPWDREEIDVVDREDVNDKILEYKPNIIINAAAYNNVDGCENNEKEFEKAKKINGNAVGYLADVAIDTGALLIHYSTDYVFSGDKKAGYKEDDNPAPISKYGESKLLGEQEIKKRIDKGLKYYLIRTSKLFGPSGEGEAAKPSFFDIMLKLAKKRDKIDVVNEEVSCFTYTCDLAQATKDLIESKKEFSVYHVINSDPVTWYEAACELFKIAGIKVKINAVMSDKFPRPARRPKYSELLNTKLKPLRNYKKALEEYINQYKPACNTRRRIAGRSV